MVDPLAQSEPARAAEHASGKTFPRKRDRRGASLLICIAIVTFSSVIVIAMLDFQTAQMTVLRNTADYDRAGYLASAGVHHALAQLEYNFAWRTGIPSTEYPAGSGAFYSAVAVTGTGETVVVTGTGTAGGVTRNLQVTVGMSD